MRPVVGFIFLQTLLVAAGLGLLRSLGLVGSGAGEQAAALGAALLTGTAAIGIALITLLVIGVPFTLVTIVATGLAVAAAGWGVAVRRQEAPPVGPAGAGGSAKVGLLRRVLVAGIVVWAAVGAYALARAPTRNDDARIWSLKGLTLTYYDSLRPEIFLNPATTLAHPVYPVFQPVLEATLGRAMGRPELALFHSQLWLLFLSAIATVVYLLWRRGPSLGWEYLGLVLLALLAIMPAAVSNIWAGFADMTGAVLVACGTLAVGLWIEGRESGHAYLGALLLAAGTNTKDEDLVGAALVLVIAGAVVAVRGDRPMLSVWLRATAVAVALSLPWRVWTAAHHLRDSVQPPLPRALSPAYVLDRIPQLRETAAAMLQQSLSGWKWLAAIFLVVCAVSIARPATRRVASFYLLCFVAIIGSLLWLYTTTPLSLAFLIPTSMNRTVMVFMVLTPLAAAHLLARILSTGGAGPERVGARTGVAAQHPRATS